MTMRRPCEKLSIGIQNPDNSLYKSNVFSKFQTVLLASVVYKKHKKRIIGRFFKIFVLGTSNVSNAKTVVYNTPMSAMSAVVVVL